MKRTTKPVTKTASKSTAKPDPIRVLVYAPTIGRGGVHLVVKTLMNALATDTDPDEWHFAVLGQRYDEIGLEVEWPKEWPFTQIEPLYDGQKLPAHPRQFAFLAQMADVFVDHLVRLVPHHDLVYCPSPWWTMPAEWPEALTKKPFVTTLPDFAFDFIDMGTLAANFRVVSQRIADRADLTIFPSDFQREHGEALYGFGEDGKKTKTISHSADFLASESIPSGDEAERVREKYGLPANYVLAFHPAYHKDPVTILRAQKLARSLSPNIPPLVMAGIGTEHFLTQKAVDHHIDDVRKTLKEIGIQPGIDFWALGTIPNEDVAGLHAGATVALIASRSEGDLSGPMFEAMMARTPLIFSDLRVFTDRLGTDETYGLTFPVGEFGTLAAKLIDLCEHADDARERAKAAYAFARKRTVHDVVKDYLKAFKEVLNR